jgi:hypothetical protein
VLVDAQRRAGQTYDPPIAGEMLLSGLAVIWSILHDRRSVPAVVQE